MTYSHEVEHMCQYVQLTKNRIRSLSLSVKLYRG